MLKVFKVKKIGSNVELEIGDGFQYKGASWVIIAIGNFKIHKYATEQTVIIEVVAQNVGTVDKTSDCGSSEKFEAIYMIENNVFDPDQLLIVGSFDNGHNGIVAQIIGIKDIKYNSTDISVTYLYESVCPWSEVELNLMLKKKKMKKFKIIS